MIQTQGLTKIYKNGFRAVDGLNLHVDEGDIFGFLGPNGAGKTTTIRMLDGLLQPTAGSAHIAGMDITRHPVEIRRIIGVVPESHGYYYAMTPREYLQYFAALFDPHENAARRIDYLLERVGLAEKRSVPIGQFSRGMKQRLGVAKALINRPRIIFLDEPTLGLDPRGQHEIQQLLLEINRTDRITIFITSHLLKDIEVLCNRVSIVQHGTLVEQGSIAQLRETYMPNYTLHMRTSDDVRAMTQLDHIPELLSVARLEDHALELKFKSDCSPDDIARAKHGIVTAMFAAGIDVEELARCTLSMEDIFFRATETKKQEAAS